ncbi:hypothetical protein AB0395_01180 [Streptosporangium sp. NPDC051023]|uniref:hypothetical protein n=1 Tax=Streptosporangium sp. NPDC051023 TaxID=3155410 RepID=UPI003450554C
MIRPRPPRTPGRHRSGLPYAPVHRRVWDGPARAEAELLERSCTAWVVLYSLGNRRFYAIATWPAPGPVIVEGTTAEGVRERMRDVEAARPPERRAA